MKHVTLFFDFYINVSIHVALAVCSLLMITLIELDLDISFALMGFVFFGTISGYNFVKYMELVSLENKRLSGAMKSILLFSIICFVAMLFFSIQLSLQTLLLTAALAILTFFYAVPILKRKNLRNLSTLKIFIVAFVWSGVTVLVPIISTDMVLNADCWIIFAQRFFIVIALTIPFEIRDLAYDISGLKTLPQELGLKKTKAVGIILLIVSVFLEGFKNDLSPVHFVSLVFVVALIAVLLIASEIKQSKYFASFWVEGVPVIWLLLLLFLEKLF